MGLLDDAKNSQGKKPAVSKTPMGKGKVTQKVSPAKGKPAPKPPAKMVTS